MLNLVEPMDSDVHDAREYIHLVAPGEPMDFHVDNFPAKSPRPAAPSQAPGGDPLESPMAHGDVLRVADPGEPLAGRVALADKKALEAESGDIARTAGFRHNCARDAGASAHKCPARGEDKPASADMLTYSFQSKQKYIYIYIYMSSLRLALPSCPACSLGVSGLHPFPLSYVLRSQVARHVRRVFRQCIFFSFPCLVFVCRRRPCPLVCPPVVIGILHFSGCVVQLVGRLPLRARPWAPLVRLVFVRECGAG